VLSVNLDIAAGAPAACMVPAVQVLVERDVLPDLTEFLDGHNDSTPRSQVRTPPRHARAPLQTPSNGSRRRPQSSLLVRLGLDLPDHVTESHHGDLLRGRLQLAHRLVRLPPHRPSDQYEMHQKFFPSAVYPPPGVGLTTRHVLCVSCRVPAALGVLSSAGTQMVGTTPAGPMWNYYLVDLTTMAPQPQLLYLLFNSTYASSTPCVRARLVVSVRCMCDAVECAMTYRFARFWP
jgi:hypothetical protein